MFICIEGIDASGKATQAALLAGELRAHLYSFPDYNTPMGRIIKSHLHRQWHASLDMDGPGPEEEKNLDAMVFQALQLANRMEHATSIAKALACEEHVVADRYWASGIVYGGADGLDEKYMEELHNYLPHPDLSLLIDIDPEMSATRRPERRDRYEAQAGLMHEVCHRYRALWHKMAERHGRRAWAVIDGRGSIHEVHTAVMKAVQRLQPSQ